MNQIENYKHLFVDVKEKSPTESGKLIVIRDGNLETDIYNVEKNLWRIELSAGSKTHWLDLSLLTTKERALELAEKTYQQGLLVECGQSNMTIVEFLTQNKNTL